jgi:hypothetical protein
MKRNKHIKIIIILLIVIIFILLLYTLSRFEKYTGVIISIENDIVIIQSLSSKTNKNINNITEETESKYYSVSIKDVLIKNYDGHKIESSELNVGDTINIFNIKENLKKDISYSIEPLHNVKMIKVIGTK